MRRAQTVRHNARPSLATLTDELGMVKEEELSPEDALRRQITEKDREIDRLKSFIQSLQSQLHARPPLEEVAELKKEFKNLELILEGTQRENVRAMADLERGKTREKNLERALAQLVGENWQSTLDISSSNPEPILPRVADSDTPSSAQLQRIRMLVMGMEQRLQSREETLAREIQKAETAKQHFEELRREVMIE